MNPEQPDQQPEPPADLRRALADLDARLGRITAEVAEVRAGLAALGGQAGPGGVRPEAPQAGGSWRPPQPAGPQHPQRSGPWQPQQGGPWQPPQPQSQQPWAPPTGASPRRAPRVTAATVIAAIGGAVMLAGIAFLLVVAIQAGLFPPIARVIAAAALAVVLIVLGLRLQDRHGPSAGSPVNPGALALVGTGLAAAALDVIAATTLYQWVPVPAAFMFVGGLSLGGMALAQRWSSGLLACLVSAGTMLLAPLISTDVELPVFVAIVGVATALLTAELGVAVRIVWSVLPAVMLAGYLAQAALYSRGEQIALIATALVLAAVAAGVAWYDSLRRSPAIENAALVVVPTALPLALLPGTYFLRPGWPYGLLLAAAYLTVAVLADRAGRAGRGRDGEGRDLPAAQLTAVNGLVGSALLLLTWVELGGRELTGFALTLSALAYVVAAGTWSRRWLDAVAGAASALALLVYLGVNAPHLALSERLAVRDFTYWDVVSAFAVTVLALAVTWWARRRLPTQARRVVMVGAVVALATFSVMIVAAGVTIGDLAGTARTGFLAAHLVVTVLWTCCAAWLVLTASPRIADARRLGFILGALALAKLLLLDLATLPGLFRVLSFIAVGAVMLAVAVRYRRETDPSGSGSPT